MVERTWDNVQTGTATIDTEADLEFDADPRRLQLVLENLFRNAVEHGGSDVTVRVGSLDGGFYVEDDGPGIPADDRAAVFETGYSTGDSGTGFGLSIVAQLVEAHGWDIRVGDGADGGARFEIAGIRTRN